MVIRTLNFFGKQKYWAINYSLGSLCQVRDQSWELGFYITETETDPPRTFKINHNSFFLFFSFLLLGYSWQYSVDMTCVWGPITSSIMNKCSVIFIYSLGHTLNAILFTSLTIKGCVRLPECPSVTICYHSFTDINI